MSVGVSLSSHAVGDLDTRRPNRYGAWVAVTIPTVIAVLGAVGLLVVIRRLAGALHEQMPLDALLLTAMIATATMAAARVAWQRTFSGDSLRTHGPFRYLPFWDQAVGWGSSLALALLAFGSCYPANHTSDWLIWLPLLVADQFWRQSYFDAGHFEEASLLKLVSPEPELASRESEQVAQARAEQAEQIVQQLFRLRDELGRESIYGTLRADFQPGQRNATVHVGFCPPLSHLPKVEVEPLSGPLSAVKVVQALAHGTRLDIRLAAPAVKSCQVLVDMAAVPAVSPE